MERIADLWRTREPDADATDHTGEFCRGFGLELGSDSERFRGSGLTSGIDGVIIDTSKHGFCLVRAEP